MGYTHRFADELLVQPDILIIHLEVLQHLEPLLKPEAYVTRSWYLSRTVRKA